MSTYSTPRKSTKQPLAPNVLLSTPSTPKNRKSPEKHKRLSQISSSIDSRLQSVNNTPSRQVNHGDSNIKVIARFRPENTSELANDSKRIVNFVDESTINIESGEFNGNFTFDRVFDMNSAQCDVFQYSMQQTVVDFFNGYNGTVLAYGQTGSGKSYTMMGSLDDESERGLIPRISDQIFSSILNSSSDIEYTVGVSYMEIYMEQIRDLLNPKAEQKFVIHEDKLNGVYVKGLEQVYVTSTNELHRVMRQGTNARAVASTNMNQESSRSHAIFQIKLNQKAISTGTIKKSHLFLVDLAGSEKVGKTGASGQTLEEAKKINSSLSVLGNVINSLTDGKSKHIPYRDSKLTRILQESLGGNSRTSLMINCSPSSLNDLETLSTLRFGARAKKIKNNAHINTELSSTELKKSISMLTTLSSNQLQYIKELEAELLQWRVGHVPSNQVELKDSKPDITNFIAAPLIPTSPSIGQADFQIATELQNQMEELKDTQGKLKNELQVLKDENRGQSDKIKSLEENLFDKEKDNLKLKESIKLSKKHPGISTEDLSSSIISTQSRGEDESVDPKILLLEKYLQDSNRSRDSLLSDLQEKCEKVIELELELDQNREKLKSHHLKLKQEDERKFIVLEKTLEQFSNRLNEMELQNQNLRKDIIISQRTNESRNERIKILEKLLKEQQIHVSKESENFEQKLSFLRDRISAVRKIGSPRPASGIFTGLNINIDDFTNSSASNGEVVKGHNRGSSIGSERKGLNLRIVKPLRGGGGNIYLNADENDADY